MIDGFKRKVQALLNGVAGEPSRQWKKVLRKMSKGFFVLMVLTAGTLVVNSCEDSDNDETESKIDLQVVAEGYVSPLGVVATPDNTGRLFVIDQIGKIWIIDSTDAKVETPFLDLTNEMVSLNTNYDERGLLGLAFHPDFETNGKFYVYYQLPPRAGGPADEELWDNLSRIAEFTVSESDANVADIASERTILEWDDPQSNHNGGTIAFGGDGYLYISLGDGGAADDVAPGHVPDWYEANEGGNGQDVEANLFGSILRIDVNTNSEGEYGIPADNPFVNKAGLDEIYAYGFRNPYRMSFDMATTNVLYVGDAGQSLYEEIDLVTLGGNYGWNVKEGTECFNAANDKTTRDDCPSVDVFGTPLTDPVIEVNNAANPEGGKALTIIGGNVYRGSAIPELQGVYIFGTFAQSENPDGELFMSRPAGSGQWDYEEMDLKSFPNDLGYFLKGFGQDNDGEIYVTVSSSLGPSGTTGEVYRLVRTK
jgi:glucose/arabinose dehydrogenase